MDDNTFASRKSSLRAFIWYIYIYIYPFHQKCHLCLSGSHPSIYNIGLFNVFYKEFCTNKLFFFFMFLQLMSDFSVIMNCFPAQWNKDKDIKSRRDSLQCFNETRCQDSMTSNCCNDWPLLHYREKPNKTVCVSASTKEADSLNQNWLTQNHSWVILMYSRDAAVCVLCVDCTIIHRRDRSPKNSHPFTLMLFQNCMTYTKFNTKEDQLKNTRLHWLSNTF